MNGLHPLVSDAVRTRLGWSGLRPVQELAIAPLLAGHSALITAPTAGGKTEAALLPLLSRLVTNRHDGLGVVWIAPMKALLNDLFPRMERLTAMVGLRAALWHGDTPAIDRRATVREPPSVLLATPEAIEAMFLSRNVDERALFGRLHAVVVDEIHAWAPTARGVQLCALLARLDDLAPSPLQRIGLSATVADPAALAGWLEYGRNRTPVVVSPPGAPPAREFELVEAANELALASVLLPILGRDRCLVFCNSRRATEDTARVLADAGLPIAVHHGGISRDLRLTAESRAKAGVADIVCTSTMEMGIDIGDLDRVIQIGPPPTATALMQRIGRTGRRANRPARMTIVVANERERTLATTLVDRANSGWLESIEPPNAATDVFRQQALAMAVAHDGTNQTTLHSLCTRTFGLSALADEVAPLVAAMVQSGTLDAIDDHLVLGAAVERRYAYRGYSRLCSVIEDSGALTVEFRTGGTTQLVGELRRAAAEGLEVGETVRLGGRAWEVKGMDQRVGVVMVG